MGGSSFFRGGGGGGQMLISIEPHITCDFQGGVRTPLSPPLDPHKIRGVVKTDRKQEFEYADRQTCLCRVLKR